MHLNLTAPASMYTCEKVKPEQHTSIDLNYFKKGTDIIIFIFYDLNERSLTFKPKPDTFICTHKATAKICTRI